MKIKAIKINNFVGIDEMDWNPSPGINLLVGPKGSGKTSVVESIEAGFAKSFRRTEVIRHNEDEATIYIRTDNGLEIDRRLRKEKSDYLKVRKEGKGTTSTEGELRKLFSGDIFKPLDFINLDVKQQTKIILSMIRMDYSAEEICNWFGVTQIPVNFDKHILQVLKDIENLYYSEREEINRQIRTLEAQIQGIEKELPPNYDGEHWKAQKVQEYYQKVSDAQEINAKIERMQALKEGFEDRVMSIKAEGRRLKAEKRVDYIQKRQNVNDTIEDYENEIDNNELNLESLQLQKEKDLKSVDNWLEEEIGKLKKQAAQSKAEINMIFETQEKAINEDIQSYKYRINLQKEQLPNLDEKEQLELDSIGKDTKAKIEAETLKLGEAGKYLDDTEPIEIEPLQAEADEVAEMQSYLREWDRMIGIREGELSHKKDRSEHLTELIQIAREKPAELLKIHPVPLEGISIDDESRIRINGTLLDGLSDGEKLENAFKIALQQIGELRIMCLDGFEKLNQTEQVKVLELCENHDIQAFVTITEDTNGSFEIKTKEEYYHGE